MTLHPIQIIGHFFSVLVLSTIILTNSLSGEETHGEYAFYTSPEGTSYVAVGLRGVPIPSTAITEVVFLVDTSASQAGQTRNDTLATLHETIKNLPANAQIQILAMDVETESLTTGFVTNGSPELNNALAKLQRRVPLGATDIGKGLEIAQKTFASRSIDSRRAVVYFGNGRSMAKTVDIALFEKEVNDYVAERIPFTACAVGVGTNLGLIGAFTNQTGGNLIDMNTQIQTGKDLAVEQAEANKAKFVDLPKFPQIIGKQIADSVGATIVWPYQDSYAFPEEWEIYPKTLQPIRSDRETILVGRTNAEKLTSFTLKLKGATPGNEMDLAWNFVPNQEPGAASGNNFLVTVLELAAKDNGLTMPIVGWDSLATIRDGFIVNITDQINKADAAIKTGNRNQAMTILNNVLRLDPKNKTAERLYKTAEKCVEGEPLKIEDDENTNNADSQKNSFRRTRFEEQTELGEKSGDIDVNTSSSEVRPTPQLVDAVTQEQNIVSQKVMNEVRQTINDAALRMNKDPEGALQNLKLTASMVRDNTSLNSDERNLALDRIGNTIRQVQHVQYIEEFRRIQADTNDAAKRDRLQSLHDLQESRVKAVQIFNRFASLMEAKEYKVATTVAEVAMEMIPDSTTPFAAQRLAEMASYIVEYNELRHRRHVGFVESLMEAERSFIPIPEEPPLTYIEPERWLILTQRRRERYAVSDLSQTNATEKKISKALEKNMDLDLDENTTFEDLFNMIKDKNPGINIAIDPKGAGALGITSSSPVVREPMKYNGIKLRSILRIILSEQDLTYCIKNEVLLITSEEEAKKYMSVKVYPMADLVVDPAPISGGMGGMMGGMGGMMNGGGMSGSGGGMSGMSGMGGGMGGMGGGMGGGGMGGGMWSIPDEVRKDVPAKAKQIITNAKSATNLTEFWDTFFSANNTDQVLIKEIGYRLLDEMKAQKPVEDQVVAFVESAILNDARQSWMYEALAITLYRKGAPIQEVERAVLSAADFCENPIDLMNVGFFMRTLGMKQKAFPLYKQALEVMVPKQEFYSATLRLGQELYDEFQEETSLRWIALAILAQEWDNNSGKKMAESALNSLQNLEAKMQKNGRKEEATQLAAEIREAGLRDCVVTIEWTGNAGLDLMVREPTDAYCWFANPRTLSGGILKTIPVTESGEIITGTLTEQSGVKKISYVCPKGFNGRYAVVLRKDWGELTNNMVKIAVETNIVPNEKRREGTAFQMKQEGIIVCFDLETGRRTESLEEGILDVASLRMSVAQQQMVRNNALKRLADDGVLGQIVGGSGGSNEFGYNPLTSGSGSSRNYYPYNFGPSAVGYRPVITTLPQGAMLMSNAVVSADRRYVRISPSPQFTDIRSVFKYNIAGGDTEDMTNMTGSGSGSGSGMGSGMGSGGY
ncbi:MAG: VWA domain-containing protein [Planctomycetaceae bacterium]|jgi:tetratricopeptide (TPR) repeat protein|nr:VWA domain-containing protein [Planctomycetaceae bacterium]